METEQHRLQMDILISSLKPWLYQSNKGYVSGNMFVYFSPEQVKNEDFKGPDVFVVLGVSNHVRKSWIVWEEGKAPDIVIELLSESTAKEDKGKKKQIYQNKLKVPEYYWFDPFNAQDWAGFEFKRGGSYEPIVLDAKGRLVSESLGLALTRWHGIYEGVETIWLRWETLSGELLLTPQETRDVETQRANTAEQRANIAEQRAEQLSQLLREQGINPDKLY
jgi:Uma2 family endonuclease